MHWIISTFTILLCTFLKAESLLFHGQTNGTSTSDGNSDTDLYKQLLNLQTVLISLMQEQKQQALQIQQFEQQQILVNGEIQMLKQWNRTAQMKINNLENSLIGVQSENKILKERLDNLNSLTMSSKQNLTTSEDLQRLENILTFEIEQTVRNSEEKIMKNISATVTGLELRDRYLSLSLLDVHSNMTILDNTLSKLKQQRKTNEVQQNMTLQHLSLSLLDVHNNTAGLSSSLSNVDAQQKKIKSEIQTLTNLQQNEITKLNDTIIHLKNRVQSNVAFTAGIVGEDGNHPFTGTVKFPTIIYQVGGGYNPTTGVFTAPKAGSTTYITQSASNLVVHQLQVGDRVWTQVDTGVQSKVAFTAEILGERGQHTYTLGIVKFPQVIYQVGGGYNPTTGVFTAPKAGLYFIFSTAVANNKEILRTKIMINDSVKAGVIAWTRSSSDVYQSSSNLVVHQLQVGDKVWIEVFEGSHLYSEKKMSYSNQNLPKINDLSMNTHSIPY